LRTCIFLTLLFCSSAFADSYTARVVGVSDGDSITVLLPKNKQQQIRLAEIDAPEKGQPFAERSKQALSGLVFGKTVKVVPVTTDRYGRTVAHIYVDALNVNAALIEQGAAWVYTAYSDSPLLPQLQATARAGKQGLWGLAEYEQIPPWEWRRGRRTSRVTDPGVGRYSCDARQYCNEMTSCDEARWHLQECGLTTLDGDGDGVPCERLCLQ
jgi:endonuclease YncB( thermonuclease family)